MQYANRKANGFAKLVCIIILITNLSQSPIFDENGITRVVAIPPWIILALWCILRSRFVIPIRPKNFILLGILFGVYYSMGMLFIPEYSRSALPYPIFLSLFITVTGTMAGRELDYDDLQRIFTAYIFGGVFVCISVYFAYVRGRSLAGTLYLTDSKNSLSQILLTAWILILLFKFREGRLHIKLFYVVNFIMLTYVLLALKSRATLFGMPIMVAWIIYNGKLNKRLKRMLIFGIIAMCVFLLLNPSVTEFLINNILFAGRKANNLAELSSGRSTEWLNFPSDWSNAPFFGVGRCKRESIILTALLEFGLLGGGLILALMVYPFIWGLKVLKKNNPFYLVFTGTALVYISNGVFEQLAPFGPGVKCYFIWFLMGVLSSIVERERMTEWTDRRLN